MGSPDGHGSSTGEGRKVALLLLRGRSPTEADGTSERASTLPSSNALRPDSNLNLGWYRPAAPEERPPASGGRDERSSRDDPGQADERQSTLTAAATCLDLGAEPAPSNPSDSPLGARRSRDRSTRGSQEGRRRAPGLARVRGARPARLAAVWVRPWAREVRKRPLAAGVSAALLVAVVFAAATAVEQPSNLHGRAAQPGSALSASQLRRVFLSEVTSGLDALSRSEFKAADGSPVQRRSGSHAQRLSGTARGRASRSDRTKAARMSRSSGHSTPVGHAAATSESGAQGTSGTGMDAGTIAAPQSAAQTTPVQQAPLQQTSSQQPVHYQRPEQPAGPAGLGSQVGGNCNPKCS